MRKENENKWRQNFIFPYVVPLLPVYMLTLFEEFHFTHIELMIRLCMYTKRSMSWIYIKWSIVLLLVSHSTKQPTHKITIAPTHPNNTKSTKILCEIALEALFRLQIHLISNTRHISGENFPFIPTAIHMRNRYHDWFSCYLTLWRCSLHSNWLSPLFTPGISCGE